jgi:hypothetical protein
MEKIEIDTYFGDTPSHVEISAPHGTGGAVYQIVINKYYNGSLMKTANYDWQVHLHPNTNTSGR